MMSWLPICHALADVIACAALAAYSSPPARFYSLLNADTDGIVVSAPAWTPVRTYFVDVVAVRVPPSVAGRWLVAQAGSGQVDVLETDRRASPVADEIRAAPLSGLALQIRTMNLYDLPYDGRRPVYHIAVDVQRFDAWRGSRVLVDTVWTVRIADDRQLLTCRSIIQKSVLADTDDMVKDHRRAPRTLASQMAQALLACAAASAEMTRLMPGCLDSMTSTVGK